MSFISTTERGDSYWIGPGEQPASEDEAIARLDQWCEDGAPVFTKEAIRDVAEQLEWRPLGDKIVVRGLDGGMVGFDVITGKASKAYPEEEEHLEHEVQEPFIKYSCSTHLSRHLQSGIIRLHEAYCSLQITHWTTPRNKVTKEPVVRYKQQARHLVNEHFMRSIESWEGGAMCRELRSILSTHASAHEIRKVVGLACGPMSFGDQLNITSRSAFQHALLLTLRNWLSGRERGEDIACFAQEPTYTSVDKSVLEESGIQVVDDPRALLELDDSSIVFACAADLPLKEIVADLARPAVLIWNRENEDDGEDVIWSNPDTPRVRAMMHDQYDQYEFCSDRDRFSDIVIYVRKRNV
ncbi:hypothetical protein PHISP_01939 [Aspergillus sp. HF37]|nr:hypothetical protein PHISP_01939 [Aspergillus sp. HF37]